MYKQFALYIDRNHQRWRHIASKLEILGFKLYKVSATALAGKLLQKRPYDLVLIHFDTVGKEVFELCSFVRTVNPNAILIVLMTELRIRTEKRLFDWGINDVVVGKQTSASVLISRMRVRIRNGNQSVNQKNIMWLKNTRVDFDHREVFCNGTIRYLGCTSSKLLRYFLNNSNRVITREEMWESDIWGMSVAQAGKEDEGRTFDMAIGRLRRSIEINPKKPQIIITVWREGWMLARDAYCVPGLPQFLVPVVMRVYHTYSPYLEEGGA